MLRLQSAVRPVHGGTDSRDKLCFSVWRGISVGDGCLRLHCGSETIKSGGESLYPWQHMFESEQLDPAKPQWLTAQLAVRIISCVSLVCRSLSKSEALLQERRVKICMKWKTKASKERCLWEERTKKKKTHDVMRRISTDECHLEVFFPVAEQRWDRGS